MRLAAASAAARDADRRSKIAMANTSNALSGHALQTSYSATCKLAPRKLMRWLDDCLSALAVLGDIRNGPDILHEEIRGLQRAARRTSRWEQSQQ